MRLQALLIWLLHLYERKGVQVRYSSQQRLQATLQTLFLLSHYPRGNEGEQSVIRSGHVQQDLHQQLAVQELYQPIAAQKSLMAWPANNVCVRNRWNNGLPGCVRTVSLFTFSGGGSCPPLVMGSGHVL